MAPTVLGGPWEPFEMRSVWARNPWTVPERSAPQKSVGQLMSVEAVFFDIGGVVAKCDLEQYAPMAAKLFESTEECIRAEVQSRVANLETGKTDANTFWEDVGLALQEKGVGKLPPESRY